MLLEINCCEVHTMNLWDHI